MTAAAKTLGTQPAAAIFSGCSALFSLPLNPPRLPANIMIFFLLKGLARPFFLKKIIRGNKLPLQFQL
jgi:hypothetical protein